MDGKHTWPMHRQRSLCDAIVVGTAAARIDGNTITCLAREAHLA